LGGAANYPVGAATLAADASPYAVSAAAYTAGLILQQDVSVWKTH
jgi:hypothetical protein